MLSLPESFLSESEELDEPDSLEELEELSEELDELSEELEDPESLDELLEEVPDRAVPSTYRVYPLLMTLEAVPENDSM